MDIQQMIVIFMFVFICTSHFFSNILLLKGDIKCAPSIKWNRIVGNLFVSHETDRMVCIAPEHGIPMPHIVPMTKVKCLFIRTTAHTLIKMPTCLSSHVKWKKGAKLMLDNKV